MCSSNRALNLNESLKKFLIRNLPHLTKFVAAVGYFIGSFCLVDRAFAQFPSQFNFKLYAQMSAEQGNLVFSPYSVMESLSMVSAGARTHTAAEIAEVLDLSPEGSFHAHFHDRRIRYAQPRLMPEPPPFASNAERSASPAVAAELKIANAIWFDERLSLLPEFVGKLRSNYGAEPFKADFLYNSESALKLINNWVAEKTNGKITELLPSSAVNDQTALVITNAVYFLGRWQHEFDVSKTKDADFNLLSGGRKKVSMMEQEYTLLYQQTAQYQAVKLPYLNSGLSMMVVVPNEVKLFPAVEQLLARGQLSWESRQRRVTLFLPKFLVESGRMQLDPALKKLGLKTLFDPASADLSGMAANSPAPLYVEHVYQKAFIIVDEKGTEASAATGWTISAGAYGDEPPEPAVMRVDKPFFFLIINEIGDIFFMGRVLDPTENKSESSIINRLRNLL